jgi:hypothetical protein
MILNWDIHMIVCLIYAECMSVNIGCCEQHLLYVTLCTMVSAICVFTLSMLYSIITVFYCVIIVLIHTWVISNVYAGYGYP